jgi:hypothetical protein
MNSPEPNAGKYIFPFVGLKTRRTLLPMNISMIGQKVLQSCFHPIVGTVRALRIKTF